MYLKDLTRIYGFQHRGISTLGEAIAFAEMMRRQNSNYRNCTQNNWFMYKFGPADYTIGKINEYLSQYDTAPVITMKEFTTKKYNIIKCS